MENRRPRRVSYTQLSLLCDFLESQPAIAKASNRSREDKSYAEKKWTELSCILNAERLGVYKDWRGWSKYWVDYKAKLKNKIMVLRSEQIQTNEEALELSALEKRFLQILEEPEGQSISNNKQYLDMDMPNDQENEEYLVHKPVCYLSEADSPIASQEPPKIRPIRRRRREPIMTQEAARRSLVNASQLRARATMRSVEALEAIAQRVGGIENSLLRIERSFLKLH